MNSVFRTDEDFDFSDDDSLELSFFGQQKETKGADQKSTCNTNSQLNRIMLTPLSDKATNSIDYSHKNHIVSSDTCNFSEQKAGCISQLVQCSDSSRKQPFLCDESNQKTELTTRNTRFKSSVDANQENLDLKSNFNDINIPSDDSFENEIDLEPVSLSKNETSKDGQNIFNRNSLSLQSRTWLSNELEDESITKDLNMNKNYTESARDSHSSHIYSEKDRLNTNDSIYNRSSSGKLINFNRYSQSESSHAEKIMKFHQNAKPASKYSIETLPSLHASLPFPTSSKRSSESSTNCSLNNRELDTVPTKMMLLSNEKDETVLQSHNNLAKNGTSYDSGLQFTPGQKRKFPGPAGLLPKLNSIAEINKLVLPSPKSVKKIIKTPKVPLSPAILTMRNDEDFKKPFWLNLQKEALTNCKGLVNHTIASIIRKASRNQLDKGKVPLLCSLIKVFSLNGSDASIVLKDPTGEIHGTVHKRVLEHHQLDLCPGAGIILKQVSIFSPSAKKHYVNITPSNIILLLPAEQVTSSQASQFSQAVASSPAADEQSIGKDVEEPRESKRTNLEDLFDEEDDLDSWLGDNEFLEEIPSASRI